MSNTPKVSVIMAVRNGESTVAQTIESILSQTYKDFEFIIVNDASDDSTGQIIEKYAKKDKRIRVITNKERKERVVSRNIAIENSKGKYIAVTDGDDISLPNRFDVQVQYLERSPGVYLVGSRAQLVNEKCKRIGVSFGKKEPLDVSEILEKGNVLVHSSFMFRNTHEVEYRDKLRAAEDYDLLLQILAKGKKIVLLPNILVKYRDKENLVFNDYLINQYIYSEKAKQIYREVKTGKMDGYERLTPENITEGMPEMLMEELEFLRSYTEGDYRRAREQLKSFIKKYGFTMRRGLYFVDTFFGGRIILLGKTVKRIFVRFLNL